MIERRKSNRHTFHLRAELIQKETGQTLKLLRSNIGFGGIGGYGAALVDPGSEVFIRFTFPQRSGEDKQEDAPAKVIWAHRDGNFNAIGIAFSSVSRQSQPLLFSYLQYSDQLE